MTLRALLADNYPCETLWLRAAVPSCRTCCWTHAVDQIAGSGMPVAGRYAAGAAIACWGPSPAEDDSHRVARRTLGALSPRRWLRRRRDAPVSFYDREGATINAGGSR